MEELHVGTRPGRPGLMLMASAALLAGMLGLAWVQTYAARALGPPVELPGTPLVVRVPHGWVPSSDTPGVFLPELSADGGRRGELELRLIQFQFTRTPVFQPLGSVERELLVHGSEIVDRRPARIGRFDGVEIVRRDPTRRFDLLRVIRVACLPKGEIIRIDYVTLTEPTPADFQLLDAICAAVEVREPAYQAGREAALAAAGIAAELPAEWHVSGAEFDGGENFRVQGMVDGYPGWVLSAGRSWLSAGRTPRDLLASVAEHFWMPLAREPVYEESTRPDGLTVAKVTHPRIGATTDRYQSARVVVAAPHDVLLILTISDADHWKAAEAAADALAGAVRFVDGGRAERLAAAEAAGRQIVQDVRERGMSSWWAGQPQRVYLLGVVGLRQVALVSERQPLSGEEKGYSGFDLLRLDSGEDRESAHWAVADRGDEYVYSLRQDFELALTPLRLQLDERRTSASRGVTRTLLLNERESTQEFVPGESFICPPLEALVEWIVAQSESGTSVLVEVSTRGPGPPTRTRIYRPYAPDARGRPRLLRLEDFSPGADLLTFDASGNLVGLEFNGGSVEQVDEQTALRRVPGLRRELSPR